MLRKQLIVLFGLLTLILMSCSPKQSEIVVATYDDSEIQMKEFEKAYVKNVGNEEAAKKDSLKKLEDFLDLYTIYKMKLADAKARNFDKDTSIVNELEDYRKSIGETYFLEKYLYEKGIKDLYNKRKDELRISHILIRTDTLSDEEAKKKALDIIKQIEAGKSFEEMAAKYSQDKFSAKKGGDIYYLTAGLVIPDFEDAAYNTPVGKVYPKPIKTKYGYHIIKVTDRRRRIPKVKAAHILIRTTAKKAENDTTKKYELIKELKNRIAKGEDFAELAKEYSEDPGSKKKGGNLGWFMRRQMVQPFDEAVFNLKVGEVSDIVKTRFGYHLIKLLDAQKYPSFDKEKKQLRSLYEKSRKARDKKNLVDKIAKEMNFVQFENAVKKLFDGDTTKTHLSESYFNSELHEKAENIPLMEINGKQYTLDDIVKANIKKAKNVGRILNEKFVNKLLENFKEDKLIELKAEKELKNDPEFVKLMDEYKNGIYIFRLQEKEVWSKINLDSARVKEFYEKTKEQYKFPNRVEFEEIFSRKDSLIHDYYNRIKAGEDFTELAKKYTERLRNKSKAGNAGLIDATKNEAAKHAFALDKEGDISEIFKNGNGWSIVKLIKKVPARLKTFEEARAEVTSKFQDLESKRLEEEYTSRLKETYKPKMFYDKLKNAFKTE